MTPFFTPSLIFPTAIALRLILLLYGLYQDAHSPLPYTDIDYHVFTSAASYIAHGRSPYERETYRYTPLLAWLLLPTTWSPPWFWFHSGKLLFAASDIASGWLMVLVLQTPEGGGMTPERALRFASLWLLNPMVATISTRGSSEGLLGVMVVGVVWAVVRRKTAVAGALLGLAVHFKIYPFIYGVSILWYLETPSRPEHKGRSSPSTSSSSGVPGRALKTVVAFLNKERLTFLSTSLLSFTALNTLMYTLYGPPFLQHTYLHHLTRIDHRHNFSPYNTLLHLSSSTPPTTSTPTISRLAFLPQLLLSALLLPLALSKRHLPSTLLAQTHAFVALNKVVTSQYFLWYLVLLPFYLPYSSFLKRPRMGMLAAGLWVGSQALYLQRAYALEFLGESTFVWGLWGSGLLFLGVNCWVLGVVVEDVGRMRGRGRELGGESGKAGRGGETDIRS